MISVSTVRILTSQAKKEYLSIGVKYHGQMYGSD